MSQSEEVGVIVYEDAQDEQLMTLYAKGDERAFQELFMRYKGRVYAYLLKRVQDPKAADDLFQTAFLNLHRSSATYESERLFSAWVFSICRNVIRDYLRNEKRIPSVIHSEQLLESQPAQSTEEPMVEAQLEQALSQITPREREAIRLRYNLNLEFEEIARSLDTSTGNVRQLISRATRKIRCVFE